MLMRSSVDFVAHLDQQGDREFLPVTDDVVRNHLLGTEPQGRSGRGFTIGVYPMLPDETCWFLAADFDWATWQEDAIAFLETCALFKAPAMLERSRSGNGGHCCFFFSRGVKARISDQRPTGTPIEVEFHGALRTEQQQAADALLLHDIGVLAASTAFGKTVTGAYLIAQRKVNTLVIVHRRQLLNQWLAALGQFLGLGPEAIGQSGGGKHELTGRIDVAMIRSLSQDSVVDDIVGNYGHVIVDECHHVSAVSFERVVGQRKARYVTGLSATVARKDGHQPIIFMQCGPIRHQVDDRKQAETRPFAHKVIVRHTRFGLPPHLRDTTALPIQDLHLMPQMSFG